MKTPSARLAILGIFVLALLLCLLKLGFQVGSADPDAAIHKAPASSRLLPQAEAKPQKLRDLPARQVEPDHLFSPEMEELVAGIRLGKPVHVEAGGVAHQYLFRVMDVTADDFTISSGPDTTYPSSYEVYEGRRMMPDGTLGGKATLAVVNDTVSMAYSTNLGDFLIERNVEGKLVQKTLTSHEAGSTHGHFACLQGEHASGAVDLSGDSPAPPDAEASITLAAEEPPIPNTQAALASHPYFRLGPRYDASLKDIRILMISGSTQTGTSSNLSSRAASYFTIAAQAADVYERQLGLRYQLQELILIASDSGQPDIEYDDSVTPNAKNQAADDLNAVRDWCIVYRPQASYGWGHVQAWTLVNGDVGATIGWAWGGSYGSPNDGISVSERSYGWGVIIHELGHNCGAGHTIGGAMNPTTTSVDKENFFKEDDYLGGCTAATQIHDYMAAADRDYVFGPETLRNPIEMPFGVDDAVSTPADTPVTFNPLNNDLTATPLYGLENGIRLIEVGQVYPLSAGTLDISGNEITFTPASAYTGNVWFTYTLGGDVGNGGKGWLHSADVVITVGGNSSNPGQSPSITTVDDVIAADLTQDVRLNPLLNDEGKGRLWVGGVDAISDVLTPGTAESYSDPAFHLVSAVVLTGKGSVTLEKAKMGRDSSASQDNTGYLVYSPGVNEFSQVIIQYTVKDSSGSQANGTIYINDSEFVSVTSDLSSLVEREGRVATITFTRTGPNAASEWVDFYVGGQVDLAGPNSDVALSGFDSFDATTRMGRLTIPASQASASLKISAMEDSIKEKSEALVIGISALQSLAVDPDSQAVEVPVVEAGEISSAVLSQNFDGFSSGTSLGSGWTNSGNQSGVWTARSGPTPYVGYTGPTGDHTPGNGGNYLFRYALNNYNQRADLLSPTINMSGSGPASMELYYHMFGADMGELRVDVYSGGVWNLNVMPLLKRQQQNSSSAPWRRALIDVSAYRTSDFRVRVTGVTGGFFRSDIAVDDFAVGNAYTPPTEAAVISGQSQSLTVDAGDPAYFSVVARAYPSPTYQWKKNGVAIAGATRSVLHLDSVSYSHVGDYTCEVTSGGTVTTVVATLAIAGAEDTDADGLLDGWEILYFGNLAQGPNDDPDGDGDDNLTEFNNGTDPANIPPEVTIAVTPSSTITLEETSLPWTPANITTSAWYDASDTTKVVLTNGKVSEWKDKSGNNRHVSQANSTNQPTHVSAWLNGPKVISSDGDDILTKSGLSLSLSKVTIAVVSKYDTGCSNYDTTVSLGDGADNLTVRNATAADDRLQVVATGPLAGPTYASSAAGSMPRDQFNVTAGFYDGSVIGRSINGTAGSGTTDIGSPIGVTDITLLANHGGGGTLLGDIAEVVIVGASDEATRQRLEGYLAHKWSLAGKLADGHPYKDAPPTNDIFSVIATLDGTVTDANGDSTTTTWSKVSGPGAVSFANASAVDTTVTFTVAGSYTLRLTATDEHGLTAYQEVTITVTEPASSYTVTLDKQGGTGGSSSVVAAVGDAMPAADAPTRSGHVFQGYFSAVNGGGAQYYTVAMASARNWDISSNGTLYAHWLSNYNQWSGSTAFGGDDNGDGVTNGLAWLLGASDKNASARGRLPQLSRGESGELIISFTCLRSTARGAASLKVQASSDLGLSDAWNNREAEVPDITGTINGIQFTITPNGNPDLIDVEASIPAGTGNCFGRLMGSP